jgi:hypothetical protein
MGLRLVRTSFGSLYLIAHVLHYPPLPSKTALKGIIIIMGTAVIKQQQDR